MASTRQRSCRQADRPALFQGRVPLHRTPELDELWRRHFAGERDATDRLAKLYAPLCWVVAVLWKRRRSQLCRDDVDVMATDGLLGLFYALRGAEPERNFRAYAQKAVSNYVMRGQLDRRGFPHHQYKTMGIIAEARATLIQENGRVPTPNETAERLAGIITNPQMQIGEQPTMTSFSDLRSSDRDADARPRTIADPRVPSPDTRLLSRETVKLAMRGLKGADREILKLLLKGHTQAEIAKRLNVSLQRIKQRLNGVLWEARGRADLARHADAQPQAKPAVPGHALPTPVKGAAYRLAAG